MKPYYEDGLVTLYHGDCLQITEWLTADVLVTDPPYGMAYESNFNRIKGTQKVGRPVAGDSNLNARDDALAMWSARAAYTPERPALVFGRWNMPRPEGTRNRLIWDKVLWGMGDLSSPWGPGDEEIYVLGSGFAGKRGSNVIRAQGYAAPDSNRPKHPTPKPIGLMEILVASCPPGAIADPFAGSGATLVAARNLGRKAIGVELSEEYCEMVAKRLSQQAFDFSGIA